MEEGDCRRSNDEPKLYAFDTESHDFLVTNPEVFDPESTATLDEVLNRLQASSDMLNTSKSL